MDTETKDLSFSEKLQTESDIVSDGLTEEKPDTADNATRDTLDTLLEEANASVVAEEAEEPTEQLILSVESTPELPSKDADTSSALKEFEAAKDIFSIDSDDEYDFKDSVIAFEESVSATKSTTTTTIIVSGDEASVGDEEKQEEVEAVAEDTTMTEIKSEGASVKEQKPDEEKEESETEKPEEKEPKTEELEEKKEEIDQEKQTNQEEEIKENELNDQAEDMQDVKSNVPVDTDMQSDALPKRRGRASAAKANKAIHKSSEKPKKKESKKSTVVVKQEEKKDQEEGEEEEEEDQEEYEVEEIAGHRILKGKVSKYIIKWKGYPSSQNTWELANTIHQDVPDLCIAYWSKITNIPTPPNVPGAEKATKAAQVEEKTTKATKATQVEEKTPKNNKKAKAISEVTEKDMAEPSKKRKRAASASESAPAPADSTEDKQIRKKMKQYVEHVPSHMNELGYQFAENWPTEKTSWNDDIRKICVQASPVDNKIRLCYIEWNNGKRTIHTMTEAHEKIPVKLIQYYEERLQFI